MRMRGAISLMVGVLLAIGAVVGPASADEEPAPPSPMDVPPLVSDPLELPPPSTPEGCFTHCFGDNPDPEEFLTPPEPPVSPVSPDPPVFTPAPFVFPWEPVFSIPGGLTPPSQEPVLSVPAAPETAPTQTVASAAPALKDISVWLAKPASKPEIKVRAVPRGLPLVSRYLPPQGLHRP